MLALALLRSTPARADEPPPTTEAPLSRSEEILDADETVSKRWYYGWSAGFAAATAGYLTVGGLSGKKSVRQETFLTAGSTTIGLLATLFTFSPSAFEPARIRAMPRGTEAERDARKKAADEALARAAKVERFTHSWLARAGGLAINLASVSIRVFVFKHYIPAAYNSVASLAVGELRVWSSPSRAMLAEPTARFVPMLDRTTAGVALVGAW